MNLPAANVVVGYESDNYEIRYRYLLIHRTVNLKSQGQVIAIPTFRQTRVINPIRSTSYYDFTLTKRH